MQWGTPVCALCSSALHWEEAGDEDSVAGVMPPGGSDELAQYRRRRARRYAIGVIVIGLLLTTVGAASGFTRWYLLALGMLLSVGGVYGLMAQTARR